MVFDIPYPLTKKGKSAWAGRFGLNAYYAGKHWAARKKDAEELHQICRLSMKKAGIKPTIYKRPVKIMFLWDDGLDIDNHAVMGKAFVDAMKGYVLKDDSRRYVVGVAHEFWDGEAIRVIVEEIGG
jgi:Holliday junction resolvase RusA-like endonuclease